MNYVLITGANGNLGGTLVKELCENSSFGVVAIASDKTKIFEMLDRENVRRRDKVEAISSEDFFNKDLPSLNIFAAVHMAFSRAIKPSKDIASSIDYSRKIYRRFHELSVPRVIYLSSQSVYGTTSEWRSEATLVSPEIIYSMAKYAGEKLLEAEFENTDTKFSSLRLDYVIQSQRLVSALCKQAKEKGVISLKGGNQTFSYIDKRDVAKAIVALIQYNGEWKHIYNVGPNKMRLSLTEIAEVIKSVAKNNGVEKIEIQLEKNDTELWSGMDSSRFMSDTGWKPVLSIYDMVAEIYAMT